MRRRKEFNVRSGILLVSIFQNRNWVLGDFGRQIISRSKQVEQIWIFSAYARNKKSKNLPLRPLPLFEGYIFTYLTVFQAYLSKDAIKFRNRSIVLYLHNELEELGSIEEQLEVMKWAHAIYFMCSKDAQVFLDAGLDVSQVRLMYFAYDEKRLIPNPTSAPPRTVLLASKFGPRKGLSIFPSLVNTLKDWHFIVTGKGWEPFIEENALKLAKNFEYVPFKKRANYEIYTRARIFLSLSNLEGGPVPLLEAMAMSLAPVVTNTGFASDLIKQGENGILLPINPSEELVKNELLNALEIKSIDNSFILSLTWDRICKMIQSDLDLIRYKAGSV